MSPDDPQAHYDLAVLYETTGVLDRAHDHILKVLQSDPNYIEALLAAGRVEIRRRNPQGSLDYLNKALTLAVKLDNDEAKSNALQAIGVAYKRLDKSEDALRNYQEALEIRKRLGQKGGMATSLSEIAQIKAKLGKPDEALASFNEALRLRREIGDKKGIGNLLLDLGSFHANRGNYDQALTLDKESLEIQREVGNQPYQALCLNNIGNMYFAKGQYQDALTYYERSLQLRETLKLPADIADSVHNLAETAFRMGAYDEAVTRYLRALEIRRTVGDKRGAAIDSYNLGIVFEYQSRYGAALSSKEEALKSFRQLQDRSFWLPEILAGYGGSLAQVGRFEDANKAFTEALGLARELHNRSLIAETLNLQGDALFYAGDFKSARPLYEQALEAASPSGDRAQILLSKANLAKVSIKEGQAQAAIVTLRGLTQEAGTLGLKYLTVECTIMLAEALLAKKDTTQAVQQLERALAASEKLGLRMLMARSHYLLGVAQRAAHNEPEAAGHFRAAHRTLDEIRKDAGSADVLKRADLAAVYSESSAR